MKNLFSVISILLGLTVSAAAQSPVVSGDSSNSDIKLKWVVQTDSTTLVYGIYMRPEGENAPESINFSHKTNVIADDMSYRLLGSRNIPVTDGAFPVSALLTENGQKVHFMMEFEKFPTDQPFSIEANDTLSCCMDIKDIRIDESAARKLDTERFLKSTPTILKGRYSDDGSNYMFYQNEGFFMASSSSYNSDYITLKLDIANESDHGVLFRTDKIKAVANVKKGNKIVEKNIVVLEKGDYRSVVASSDYYNAQHSSTGNDAIGIIESGVRTSSYGFNYGSAESVGLRALSSILSDVKYENARPYLQQLNETREDRIKNYLQSQSLKKGECYSGFIKMEMVRHIQDIKITIPINDYEYVFKYTF